MVIQSKNSSYCISRIESEVCDRLGSCCTVSLRVRLFIFYKIFAHRLKKARLIAWYICYTFMARYAFYMKFLFDLWDHFRPIDMAPTVSRMLVLFMRRLISEVTESNFASRFACFSIGLISCDRNRNFTLGGHPATKTFPWHAFSPGRLNSGAFLEHSRSYSIKWMGIIARRHFNDVVILRLVRFLIQNFLNNPIEDISIQMLK